MNWQEVCEHPGLKDLSFKIELNERGQIIMSPVRVAHSLYQGEIEYLLRRMIQQGKTMPECAIRTGKGTKVADVAWVSSERLVRVKYETECSIAPEICVEVFSESNTSEEIAEKRQLYFDNGAEEVWTCSLNGDISFYNPEKRLKKSVLAPDFPDKIEI